MLANLSSMAGQLAKIKKKNKKNFFLLPPNSPLMSVVTCEDQVLIVPRHTTKKKTTVLSLPLAKKTTLHACHSAVQPLVQTVSTTNSSFICVPWCLPRLLYRRRFLPRRHCHLPHRLHCQPWSPLWRPTGETHKSNPAPLSSN